MSRGINKAIVLGIIGQDPTMRYTADGKAVCNLSVVTNEAWTDKQGVKQEKAEWHRIVMFGRLGEIGGEYLRKGSQAYFEGKITTRKWQDNTGADRYSTEIIANEMQMLGSSNKPKENDSNSSTDSLDGVDEPTKKPEFDDIPF